MTASRSTKRRKPRGAAPPPIGYHVSATGGLPKAIERAESIGCDALQMFPSNPRGWAVPEVDEPGDQAGLDHAKERSFAPVYFHAPYLINLASSDPAIRRKSEKALAFALGRSVRIGGDGVIVHTGSVGGRRRGDALRQVARISHRLLDANPEALLIFELTAGGGNPVASLPEQAGELLTVLESHPRAAFCLDTQHLYAAGFDWPSSGGIEALVESVDESIGLERLECFHINDSKTGLGSRHDRHEILGEGEIGLGAFERLVSNPAFRGIPLILETPGELEDHSGEVTLLREMAS